MAIRKTIDSKIAKIAKNLENTNIEDEIEIQETENMDEEEKLEETIES